MRKLRAEMHRRMLGNGYCARPVELDCHFESICESCTFFVTTAEFRPTLENNVTTPLPKAKSDDRRSSTDYAIASTLTHPDPTSRVHSGERSPPRPTPDSFHLVASRPTARRRFSG
jgi:hypothetical protein